MIRSHAIAMLLAAVAVAAITAACSSKVASVDDPCTNFEMAQNDADARCGGMPLSSDERANILSRFRIVCSGALSAPGTGITTNYLDTCATALEKQPGCPYLSATGVPECDYPTGTLPVGAPCADDVQCASTHCTVSDTTAISVITTTSFACGTCGATVADGAKCAPTDTCITNDFCSNGVCVKQTDGAGLGGAAGSGCQDGGECALPNHCDSTQMLCVAPGAVGASCTNTEDCASGLACGVGRCKERLGSGAACTGSDCESGLGCSMTTHVCTTVTFAAQGAACDGDAILCDRGNCKTGGAAEGVCPTILQDGAACTANSATTACDAIASCFNGTCQLVDPTHCN